MWMIGGQIHMEKPGVQELAGVGDGWNCGMELFYMEQHYIIKLGPFKYDVFI